MDFQAVGAVVGDVLRQLLVAAGFVFADEPRNLGPGDLFYQQHVQQTVSGVRLRHGIEATTVVAAVADADHGHLLVPGLAAEGDTQRLTDAADHIHHRRGRIGPEALQQRQPLVVGNIRADAGIQTNGADVQGQRIVAANHVERGFFRIQQPGQMTKGPGLGEKPDEIVPAAAGPDGHGCIAVPCRTGGNFVQGSVAAAGVDSVFLPGAGGCIGKPPAISGPLGNLHPVVKIATQLHDLPGAFQSPVPASRRRVDDEQMLHLTFLFSVAPNTYSSRI